MADELETADPILTPPASLPTAVNDPDRLFSLAAYNVLDTLPEQGFDDIAHLATVLCDVPVALVSLVTNDRQWFKARVGFPSCQTDLNSSVCAHALDAQDLFVIPDLTVDPCTAHNPLVTGDPHLRFYAGAPLHTASGQVLGTLCVIDKVPRPDGLTERQSDALRVLARQVMALLELRQTVAGRDSFIAQRLQAESRLAALVTATSDIVYSMTADWSMLRQLSGKGVLVDTISATPDWLGQYVHPDDQTRVLAAAEEAMATKSPFDIEHRAWLADGSVGWMHSRAVPLLDEQGRVSEWFGTAVDVTERVWADRRRAALLEVGDVLGKLGSVAETTGAVASIVGRTLGAARAGFGAVEPDGDHIVIEPDWTAGGVSSVAGRYRFDDFGDIRAGLLRGEVLIVDDAWTDSRTRGERERWKRVQVRALVNIPIQERGRTVAVFLVHDLEPRRWRSENVAFARSVADRLTLAVARRRAEDQQEVLNQELSHRMKNTMAMIQAIAGQTLKGVTEQDAVVGFRQRLVALSSAHDVLLQKTWSAAGMREVIEAVLKPLGMRDRFDIAGPGLMMGPGPACLCRCCCMRWRPMPPSMGRCRSRWAVWQ